MAGFKKKYFDIKFPQSYVGKSSFRKKIKKKREGESKQLVGLSTGISIAQSHPQENFRPM